MKNDLWAPTRRIEKAYERSLNLISKWINAIIDMDASPQTIVDSLLRMTTSKEFDDYTQSTATQMITHLFTDNGRTWRQAAMNNSKGRLIYEALKKERTGYIGHYIAIRLKENAELIKSIPLDAANKATELISRAAYSGVRSTNDIVDMLRSEIGNLTVNKAKLIARTEVSKAQTELTRARCVDMDIKWYVWRTAKDGERVRRAHRALEGVLVHWDEPPAPEQLAGIKSTLGHYHAGESPNCRCYAEPVVYLKYVKFPAKVYVNGAIITMTLSQFEKIAA